MEVTIQHFDGCLHRRLAVERLADGDGPTGLSCQVHDTPRGPAGAPTLEQLQEVLVR